MGIEIEVQYYEKEDEILTKVESVVITVKDAPLKEVFRNTACLMEKFELCSKDHDIYCYAGDIAGEEISLDQHLKDIEYVLDALRSSSRPVLILCRRPKPKELGASTKDSTKDLQEAEEEVKEEEEEEEERDGEGFVRFTGRTASGMIKDMFNPFAVLNSSPGKTITPSPSSTSSASNDSVFASPERTSSYSDSAHNSFTSWNIPRETYKCQEELLSTSETLTSEEEYGGIEEEDNAKEGDGSSLASSRSSSSKNSVPSNSSNSTSTSEEGPLCKSDIHRSGFLSHGQSMMAISSPRRSKKKVFGRSSSSREEMSSPDRFLENFNPKNKIHKTPDPGYFTFRRPNKAKSKGKKLAHRFSMKPQKMASVAAEISSPSSVVKSSINPSTLSPVNDTAVSLIRHPAFRSKRGMRIGQTISDTIPEASFSLQISTVPVVFKSIKMEVPCREYHTVRDLRDSIAGHLNKLDPDRCTPWRSGDFIMMYELEGKNYELFNEWQFIYMTRLYQLWGQEETADLPVKIQVHSRGISEDIKVVYRISQLIGVAMDDRIDKLPGADVNKLRRVAKQDQKEAQWTRRVLHNFVAEMVSKRNRESYSLSMELASSSTSTILALKIPIDSKIKIIFHYKQCFSLAKYVKVQQTADSILHEIFPCLVACGLVEDRISDYTMQISGERSYIAGSHELIAFRDIRRCIIKGEPVDLSVKERPSITEDVPCTLTWRSIDPQSGSRPLHSDISRTVRRDSEIQALSSWDRSDDFTMKVEKVEQLPAYSNRTSCLAIIEATLYHGEKALCPPVTTTTRILDHTLNWKETVNFKIAKKNIPRSAKIMFIVTEAVQRKDSVEAKKAPKFLFWGLTMVFDHQGMMFNGENCMRLWKGRRDKDEKKDGDNSYAPNPSGPASNNSDPKAVLLSITFDSYGFPIHFPSCSSSSWSVLLVQPNVANVAVRKQFQRLLEFIRDGKLHSVRY